MRNSKPWVAATGSALLLALAGCGGGGGGGDSQPVSGGTARVAVNVSGLTAGTLVLQDNGGDDLAVSGNISASFATALAVGASFTVSVKIQPSGQTCTIAAGSGTLAASGNTASVSCAATVAADTRPLHLTLSATAHAAMGALVPYAVIETQGITLTGVQWSFDGNAGGHALAALANGTLQVWNQPGSHTVTAVASASNGRTATISATVAAVDKPLVSGAGHSCALGNDGSLRCWGYGNSGTLGQSGSADSAVPLPVSSFSGLLGLAAGDMHTCALTAGHAVLCWGSNIDGELGNASTFHGGFNPQPQPVQGLPGSVVAIAAGRYHTCELISDGTVWCHGDNSEHQLGTATTATLSNVPVQIGGLSGVVAIIASSGGYYTCALKSDATVVCWGSNESGELGSGTSSPASSGTPQTVLNARGGTLHGVLALRGGQSHACAIVDDGAYGAWCWGNNRQNQVSPGASNVIYAATAVASTGPTLMLALGQYDSCRFDAAGAYACWGSNGHGEASATAGAGSTVTVPTAVAGLQGGNLPEYASGGNEFSCALAVDGRARCWGRGGNGEVGNGGFVDAPTPQLASAAAGSFWTWVGP